MGGSAGGSVNTSRSKSKSQSGVYFPAEFLNPFESRYGRGPSTDELLGMLPQTQSLFGGSPMGYGAMPTGQPGGATGATATSAAAPNARLGLDQIGALTSQYYEGRPQLAAQVVDRVRRGAAQAGIDASQGLTPEQLASLPGGGSFIHGILPGLAGPSSVSGNASATSRYMPTGGGADLSALQIPQTLQRMFGIGAQQQFDPATIRDAPTIDAPTAAAGLMDVAPRGFDQYEQSVYRSLNDPVQRQLAQQGALADRQQQAELAQAGLASSGAGLGQLQTARRQRSEQSMAAAQQAAQQASTSRFDREYGQEMFNAQQRQQASLANAGFSLDAQKQNAANLLLGDSTRADNYLKTMGLNVDAANALRGDFLKTMGLAEQDLQRMDQSARDNLGLWLNQWLQTGALLGNLGQKSKANSSSSGFGISGYGSAGVGGGS